MTQVRCARVAGLLALVAGCASSSSADISDVALELTAANSSGRASVVFHIVDGYWDQKSQTFCLTLEDSYALVDPTTEHWVAELIGVNLCVSLQSTTEISLTVGVYSGTTPTTYWVRSPLVTIRTIPGRDSVGRAFGSVSVTDLDGNFAMVVADGASGAGACRASYNGEYPDGSLFTQLVGFVFAGNHSTVTGSQQDPPFGFRVIGDDVHDMSLYLAYRVSPNDIAFVTTVMDIPEPDNRCIGDINVDFLVDLADLTELLASFGSHSGEPTYDIDADFDGDGSISVTDLTSLLAAFGTACP